MRIALIDNHALFVQSLKLLLVQNGYSDVTVYTNMQDFIKVSDIDKPDMVIVELMMEGTGGTRFLEMYKQVYHNKDVKVIVLSSSSDPKIIRLVMRSGVSSYLTKNISFNELLIAIDIVAGGKKYLGNEIKKSLLRNNFDDEQLNFHLTQREQEVLKLICKGNTIKTIAVQLNLSIHTVQYYNRMILSKFKIKRKAELIIIAMRNGFYVPDKTG